jgi:hypothetical protein
MATLYLLFGAVESGSNAVCLSIQLPEGVYAHRDRHQATGDENFCEH